MKKSLFIIATLIVAAFVTVSCNKDNPSGPSRGAKTYSYRVEASVELGGSVRDMFELTGSDFACGSEKCDLEKYLANSDKYSFSNTGSTPCETHLKFTLTPKSGFVPEAGKYDVLVKIVYNVYAIDNETGEASALAKKTGGINAQGTDFAEAKSKRGLEVIDVLNTFKRQCDFDESYTVTKDGDVK